MVIVIATLFVIGSITNSETEDGSGVKAEPKPRSVDVEQFIGRTPDEAHNQLEDELKVEMTTDYLDLSPRGRDVNRYEDIIVSADRSTVTADDPKIEFWTLKAEDVKWFEQHPKMPKVKKGSACESGYGAAAFESVDDLVFVAATKPTSDAERIKDSYEFDTRQARWPADWAKTQRASVGNKWEADTYASSMLVDGQAPKAGAALKPGQLMVIYCSPQPVAPAPLVSQAPAKNCMSGYSPCLPIVADLDCGDIGHSVVVTGGDPYRLDRDGDGIGCD